jgi:hypothetical protein
MMRSCRTLAGAAVLGVCGLAALPSAGAADFSLLFPGIAPLETISGTGVRLSEQYAVLQQVRRGSERLANPGAHETHFQTELSGFTSLTPRLTLVAVVPYRKGDANGELVIEPDGSVQAYDAGGGGGAAGIGDVTLLARYTVLDTAGPGRGTRLAVLGGVKLPTGDTDARTDDGAEYLDSRIQPGSGSTDAVLGVSLAHQVERLSLSANLLGNLPGDGEAGDRRHRFGKALAYDLTGKYRVYRGDVAGRDLRCCLSLGLNGEWRGRDRFDGAIEEDSGGNTVYLAPGLMVALTAHWVFDLSYQRAVHHQLKGTQLAETRKLTGGIAYLF